MYKAETITEPRFTIDPLDPAVEEELEGYRSSMLAEPLVALASLQRFMDTTTTHDDSEDVLTPMWNALTSDDRPLDYYFDKTTRAMIDADPRHKALRGQRENAKMLALIGLEQFLRRLGRDQALSEISTAIAE